MRSSVRGSTAASVDPAARRRRVLTRLGSALAAGLLVAAAGPAAAETYQVESGDSLSVIARRHGVSTATLAAANAITDPDRIRAGQRLVIPGGAGADRAGTYRVRPGDTLSGIAVGHGTTVAELRRLNGLGDPNRIVAGRTLALPGPGGRLAAGPRPRATTAYPHLPRRLAASPERLALIPSFERWAGVYGVPVGLLMAVTWYESGWQNGVVSSKGAVGIGQLMPATSRWLAVEVLREPTLDPAVPDDNIRMAAAYLAWLRRTMGSDDLALAGYYQGPTSVRRSGPFPVTDAYIAGVRSLTDRFAPG
jgi:N-acetylmuramoyl-L-alanine amidase